MNINVNTPISNRVRVDSIHPGQCFQPNGWQYTDKADGEYFMVVYTASFGEVGQTRAVNISTGRFWSFRNDSPVTPVISEVNIG